MRYAYLTKQKHARENKQKTKKKQGVGPGLMAPDIEDQGPEDEVLRAIRPWKMKLCIYIYIYINANQGIINIVLYIVRHRVQA